MTYLYKINFAALLIMIALLGCEKKEWQHNAVEKVPVFAISDLEITTSGVSNTEKAPEKIDIYTEQELHISQVGSFVTKQDVEASKVTYAGDNVMIEYKALGEFYYTYIDETNGNVLDDTIVNPFYSYVINGLNGEGTLEISEVDMVIRSYTLESKKSEEFYPVTSK